MYALLLFARYASARHAQVLSRAYWAATVGKRGIMDTDRCYTQLINYGEVEAGGCPRALPSLAKCTAASGMPSFPKWARGGREGGAQQIGTQRQSRRDP